MNSGARSAIVEKKRDLLTVLAGHYELWQIASVILQWIPWLRETGLCNVFLESLYYLTHILENINPVI